jgi:hypothetical protein
VQPGYAGGRALSRNIACRSDVSVEHECADCDGVLNTGLLLELLDEHACESSELLQRADGAGQSGQPGAGSTAFRLDWNPARCLDRGLNFADAKTGRRSRILSTRPPFAGTALFAPDLSLPLRA